ncbi:hypothetical protein K438DRAFT_1767929 [Mycena galopus ATCC 62051]|nr:hypothetical protein K438DRAFT_1767929 [Mycena galopus ATCC 62051]
MIELVFKRSWKITNDQADAGVDPILVLSFRDAEKVMVVKEGTERFGWIQYRHRGMFVSSDKFLRKLVSSSDVEHHLSRRTFGSTLSRPSRLRKESAGLAATRANIQDTVYGKATSARCNCIGRCIPNENLNFYLTPPPVQWQEEVKQLVFKRSWMITSDQADAGVVYQALLDESPADTRDHELNPSANASSIITCMPGPMSTSLSTL